MGRTYGSGPFLSLRSKRYFLCQAQEGSTFLRSKRCFLYLSQEGSVFLRNKRRFLCLSAQRQRYFYKKRGIPVKKKFKKVEPYIWILPSVLLMAIFILVPIIFVFRMALSDVSKAGLIKGFAGFENFRKVTSSPVFAMVLKNTLVWTVAVVGISTLLGFILAILLNNEFKGRKLARAVVVFPWATTLIVQASIWKFIIDTDYGTLNTLLMKLGIIDHAVNWTPTAGAYFAWEIACGIFVTIIWTITKGDPANRTDTLVTYLYKLAFYNGKQGQAAAVSVIGFLILLFCASLYMVSVLKKGDE